MDERQYFSGQRVFRPGWVEAEPVVLQRKAQALCFGQVPCTRPRLPRVTGISFTLVFHLLVAAAADALMNLNQNVALVQLLS